MEHIPGYTLVEKIGVAKGSTVHKGKRESDGQTVVIKLLNTENSSPSEVARFKQEYEFIRKADIDGIIKTLDLVNYKDGYAIVRENFEGISIGELLKKEKKWNISSFLDVGIKLTKTLGELHKINIIHRDIKPANIIVNRNSGEVKITDFGIAKVITHEDEEIYNPRVIENTLVYISPEQSGRMNRSVDYRTDLYSLGITFYEMLIGEPPFKSADPMELIHSHIARRPTPLNELDAGIPRVVSHIVLTLLLKTPEERYQNAFGLMSDLQEIKRRITQNEKIDDFEIAKNDIPLKFIIPQIIYGREKEIDRLMLSFQRVSAGACELMLVSGHPGIGKSALINEIHKPIVERKGYFISGKYDQFRREVPYSAIIQAFNGLIGRILTESEEKIQVWRKELVQALGNNGKFITDILPKLELIIGKQPPLPELDENEGRDLFNLTFKNFMSVFAKSDHPLVLFLDDMQWVDAAGLAYIRKLIADWGIEFFLLIISYRDNEVDSAHPLEIALGKIRKAGINIESITVGFLNVGTVNKMIYNLLRCSSEESLPLAELIHKKTFGNPFFVNQFLKMIYDGGMLKFDSTNRWRFDMNSIMKMQVTDNVVDLMAKKITKLSGDVQEVLKICACIGNRFDLETISIIFDRSIDETLSKLTIAVEEGLVSLFGDLYVFHHDRIHEATYSLLGEEEKVRMHYRIGTYLLKNTRKEDLENKLLYIVSQLNSGRSLVTDKAEKYRLAELNMAAARKARSSNALESSLNFFKKALDLLDENSWEEKYEFTLILHVEAALTSYKNNDNQGMDKYAEIVLNKARDVLDKVSIYGMKILANANQNNPREATRIAIEVLRLLGVNLPKNPGMFHARMGYARIKFNLSGRGIESLGNLPRMTDKHTLAAMVILTRMTMPIMTTLPILHMLSTFKRFSISKKCGQVPESIFGYMLLSSIFCGRFNDIDTGYRLSQAALSLAEQLDIKLRYGTVFLFNSFVRFWKEHMRSILEPLLELHRGLVQIGDIQTSALSLTFYAGAIYTGMELHDLDREFSEYSSVLSKMKFPFGVVVYQIYRQQIQNLIGLSKNPKRLAGDIFDMEKLIPVLKNADVPILLFIAYLHEIIAAYTFGDMPHAVASCDEAEKYKDSVKEIHVHPIYRMYDSLARLGSYPQADNSLRKRILKRVRNNQKMLKNWAKHAPMNYLHKYHLVEAELIRISGGDKAFDYYDMAIKEALDNEYIQEAALGNERTATFWLDRGKENLAKAYMGDAIRCYSRWGATGKVECLKKKYPSLISEDSKVAKISDGISDAEIPAHGSTTSLDLSTILKTSQALAAEIDLDKLLEKVMTLAIENAGAEKGFLILENEDDGKLCIEAAGCVDETVKVMESIPLEASDGLSPAIINYVYKTMENVVLHDARKDARFSNDPYIVKNKSKSVLCSPIRHKGRMSGILYLENNLTAGAFTSERLELLRTFSAQAAISIENLRLLKAREKAAVLLTEMKIAANIQTSLLPKNPSMEGFEVTAYMKPADVIGGDYYDFIHTNDRDWVIIGDVSGHGVTAGLVMMMVQTSIQSLLKDRQDMKPSELLGKVNEVIKDNIIRLRENKYMTITAFTFDSDGRALFSGLHQDILVYRAIDGHVDVLDSDGLWLSPWDFGRDNVDMELSLKKNDVVFLFTDGITEAKNKENRMFTVNTLIHLLTETGGRPTEEIRNRVLEALKDYHTNDDVTMIILKKL